MSKTATRQGNKYLFLLREGVVDGQVGLGLHLLLEVGDVLFEQLVVLDAALLGLLYPRLGAHVVQCAQEHLQAGIEHTNAIIKKNSKYLPAHTAERRRRQLTRDTHGLDRLQVAAKDLLPLVTVVQRGLGKGKKGVLLF